MSRREVTFCIFFEKKSKNSFFHLSISIAFLFGGIESRNQKCNPLPISRYFNIPTLSCQPNCDDLKQDSRMPSAESRAPDKEQARFRNSAPNIFVVKILQISIANFKCCFLAELVKFTCCAKEILLENKLNLRNCSQSPFKSTDSWPNTTTKFPFKSRTPKTTSRCKRSSPNQYFLVELRWPVLGNRPRFLGNHCVRVCVG